MPKNNWLGMPLWKVIHRHIRIRNTNWKYGYLWCFLMLCKVVTLTALYWPLVRGIHRWLVDSLHKGQWRGALIFSLIRAWTNGWANNRDAGDLRRHGAYYGITVMSLSHKVTVLLSPLWALLCFKWSDTHTQRITIYMYKKIWYKQIYFSIKNICNMSES